MARFTQDTLISDVLVSHPGAADVLERHGFACPLCLASSMETVAAAASMHEVSLIDLLTELNELHDVTGQEE